MITQERLKELLNYDPESGFWTWKVSTTKSVKNGDKAGCCSGTKGYVWIRIDKILYRAHRLSWFYMTGEWPEEQIDHINGIRNDNTWKNLRKATNSENQQNRTISKNNTSGYNGVYWDKQKCRWYARIKINNKNIFLGYHDTPELANEARLKAQKDIWSFQPIPRR